MHIHTNEKEEEKKEKKEENGKEGAYLGGKRAQEVDQERVLCKLQDALFCEDLLHEVLVDHVLLLEDLDGDLLLRLVVLGEPDAAVCAGAQLLQELKVWFDRVWV
jgi:hypothetical protein